MKDGLDKLISYLVEETESINQVQDIRECASRAIRILGDIGLVPVPDKKIVYANRTIVQFPRISWNVDGSTFYLTPTLWVTREYSEPELTDPEDWGDCVVDRQVAIAKAFQRLGFQAHLTFFESWIDGSALKPIRRLRILVLQDKEKELSAHLRFDEV